VFYSAVFYPIVFCFYYIRFYSIVLWSVLLHSVVFYSVMICFFRCSPTCCIAVLSLMKLQFVVTHRYTVLLETENTSLILNRPTLQHVTFL
jgi:hypothetical protein